MTRPGDDAPFAEPPSDPAERAEAEWLVARDRNPAAPPPSPEVAQAYAHLEDLLSTKPAGRDDDGWQEAVLAAARADARGRKVPNPSSWASRGRWLALAGAVAAAAVAVFLVVRPPRQPTAELAVTSRRGDSSRGAEKDVLVGDHLMVEVRPRGPTELRVYQGPRTVLLRCPGRSDCQPGAARWKVDIQVTAPVPHTVILAFGDVEAPLDASMDDFLAAAAAARAVVVVHPTIDVR